MMELTCTSFSFPLLSFEDSAKAIALIGIPKIDVGAHQGSCHIQPSEIEESPGEVADRINRAVGAAGLRVSDMFATFGEGFRDRPVNSLLASEREANQRRMRALVRAARGVGASGISLLPGVVWDEIGRERSFELAVRELARLVPVAHDAGLRFSVEAHLDSVAETPELALALVQQVPGLQLTLDYSHFIANGYEPEDVHPLVPHAGHFHARQARHGHLQESQRSGTIDFADIVARLKAAGYAGDICIEYTWQEWRGANNVDVMMESILLRDQMRQLIG
jgi:sugar phosphate isomerase/epimerase